jgi:hypothetical protein
MGLRAHHLLSPGAGAVILIAWTAALAAVGIALTARRDINKRSDPADLRIHVRLDQDLARCESSAGCASIGTYPSALSSSSCCSRRY